MRREDVLLAAEALVDRDGAAALTMTALAADLGLRVSSLYNHVPSLEALRGELQNRAIAELGGLLRHEAMGRTEEGGLRALAVALRQFSRAHPGRYELAMSAPQDRDAFARASSDAAAALGAIIASFGVDDASLDLQLSAFSMLHGVISLDNAGFLQGVLDADRVYDLVVGMVVSLLRSAAPSGTPAV